MLFSFVRKLEHILSTGENTGQMQYVGLISDPALSNCKDCKMSRNSEQIISTSKFISHYSRRHTCMLFFLHLRSNEEKFLQDISPAGLLLTYTLHYSTLMSCNLHVNDILQAVIML